MQKSEAGPLLRSCLIFGQNLRLKAKLSNRVAYKKVCICPSVCGIPILALFSAGSRNMIFPRDAIIAIFLADITGFLVEQNAG